MAVPARACRACPPFGSLAVRQPFRLLLAISDAGQRRCVSERLLRLGHSVLVEAGEDVDALELARRMKPQAILAGADARGLSLAREADREGIAPVLLVLPAGATALPGMEGIWGCVPHCAAEPVLAGALDVAVRRFSEQRELDRARITAEERLRHRQVVERAKGLLMASGSMTEEQAYRFIRRRSMDSGRSLGQVAEAILLAGGAVYG